MSGFEPKFRNLVQVYKRSVEKFGPRPLFGTKVDGEWRYCTYQEFGEKVDALRGGLKDLGVEHGDRVAVISDNRPEWAMAAYATYSLGSAFVPMYEAQLDTEWEYILGDCAAKVVFVRNEAARARVEKFRAQVPNLAHVVAFDGMPGGGLTFDQVLAKGRARPVPAADPGPNDVAGFIYTSGTTGKPKGAKLSHGNFTSNVNAMHEVFPMSPEDRSLAFLPWAHSFGQTVELHGLISMGSSMGIAEGVDKILTNLGEVQPTLLFSVPRIFNRIYDGLNKRMATEGGFKKTMFEAAMRNEKLRKQLAAQGRKSKRVELKHALFDKLVFSKVRARFGGRLKYAFSGGAAISLEVAEFIDNLGITVYEGYGLTETAPIATANWPGSRRIGSVGKAIPGCRIEIDASVAHEGTDGELVVYGPNVMLGYHNLPEENARVLIEKGEVRGFRTGDTAHQDADGFIFITGRIKEQYKLENGKYVAPAPLEEQLQLSQFITSAIVYGDNKPHNVAVIVPDMSMLGPWCGQNGIETHDLDALAKNASVRKLIADEIDKHSTSFRGFERVRDFVLVFEDFTTENDMLTPSLKVKRRNVMKNYGNRVEALYGG